MTNQVVFFRIDDVGDPWGDSEYLPGLLDVFVEEGIPFNLQVIPARLCDKSADLLNRKIEESPHLVEIDQHGFSHNLKEFCSDASRERQHTLLKKGLQILMDAFGVQPIAFTAPEHLYTTDTLLALHDLQFKVFSKHIRCSAFGEMVYFIGRALRRNWIFGKKVSYHMRRLPSTAMFELSITIESIWKGGVVKTKEQFALEYHRCSKFTPVCGILLHPVHFCTRGDLDNLRNIVRFVKEKRIPCMRFADILKKLEDKEPGECRKFQSTLSTALSSNAGKGTKRSFPGVMEVRKGKVERNV